jgi:Mn-dependent DtxR family transcriptional regulator
LYRHRHYQRCFNTEDGKEVLKDLLRTHWMMTSTYNNKANRDEMLVREGERNVVLRILSHVTQDPERVLKQIKEMDRGADEYVE